MKNLRLEFIRGVASLEVFINHFCANNVYLKTKTWTGLFANWATESVILFFLLSGIVIHISQDNRHYKPVPFMINRVLRIYPSLIIGMILAIIASVYVLNEPVLWMQYAGNFFMLGTLQGYIVSSIKTNPVIWSLSFELFFYLVFAFSISKKQDYKIYVWFLLAVICMPIYYKNLTGTVGHLAAMFAFSSIWLTGYLLYKYRAVMPVPDFKSALFFTSLLPLISRLHFSDVYYDVVKYFIFGIFAIPLFLYCLNQGDPKLRNNWQRLDLKCLLLVLLSVVLFFNSKSLLTSKLLYTSVPLLVLVISFFKLPLLPSVNNWLRSIASFLGKISYSMYIIHFPVILLINHFIGNLHFILLLSVTAVVVFSIAWFLEHVFQSHVMRIYKKGLSIFVN